MTSIALITIASGRHEHLNVQYEAVARSHVRPDELILVTMDDRDLATRSFAERTPTIVEVSKSLHGLPLAAARNAGARAALSRDAQLLVFLDVDCVPAPALIGAYLDAAQNPRWRDHLLCGPVTYLPPAPTAGYNLDTMDTLAEPHPARPAPLPGEVIPGDSPALFWSLSFAVSASTWHSVGGFCERYEGYGAEDTDFARIAESEGIHLAWVGGARAFHQFHPTSTPPVQHLDDIIRNALIFRSRWDEWPMVGWLEEFARAGLIRWDARVLERVLEQ